MTAFNVRFKAGGTPSDTTDVLPWKTRGLGWDGASGSYPFGTSFAASTGGQPSLAAAVATEAR